MTRPRSFNTILATAVIGASLALAACGQSESPTEADAESGHEAPKSSSAGLPDGHAEAGAKLATAKGEATGQSCVDCHGVDGNAPIDPTYPKLGGQYADYLAHALQQYRSGDRDNVLMSSQAKPLTDQQIADLAAFFGSREGTLQDLNAVLEN